ncbi:MAG: DUF885 family protein [Steroidobacterales bacterium]
MSKYFLILMILLAGAARALDAGGVHQQLTQLAEDFVYTTARLYPTQATALGLTQYDADLEMPSEKSRAAYIAQLLAWQQRLHRIAPGDGATLSLTDRDDARLLGAQLAQQLDALRVYQQDRKDYASGANNFVGVIFLQLQFLPVAGRDGATAATVDKAWLDIMSRLARGPEYIAAAQRMAIHPGHLFGVVGSEELGGAASLFEGPLTDAATAHFGEGSESLRQFLQARAAALATIAATKAYIDAHVAAWPENFAMGRRAYDRMLRDEQLLPYDARDLERMGQEQLAQGWTEESWLTAVSQQQHRPFGPQSGGGLAPAGHALIDYYRERIAELRRFVTEHDVVTVPAWLGQMQVQETPAFMQPVSPGASMISPRLLSAETTGYYFITPPVSLEHAAANLDMNQDFDHDRILCTGAHEAMPGHFLQLSIARRHGNFVRRIQDSKAFEEGWAFYGEEMFIRLGLYGDDLDPRLDVIRWERVRGARVIVDVRLAAGEWTIQQATDFYARETSFTPQAAAAAVAAAATNPGYFIAYTVGRLQIEQLLASYWQKTAGHGSLHDFHDRLLSYGSTPLAIVGPELLADLDKPSSAVRAAANY